MVCQRWCVKDGVWKMVCDKDGVWKVVCVKCGVWRTFLGITPHPLQTVLLRTPTDAALLRASDDPYSFPPEKGGRKPAPSPQTSSYSPVWTRLEAQTICSTFGRLLLALQPFAPPFLSITSHPLASYLAPNPNGRCSPLSFGAPPFSSIFPLFWRFSFIFFRFFPTYFLPFLHFPPFSPSVTARNLP